MLKGKKQKYLLTMACLTACISVASSGQVFAARVIGHGAAGYNNTANGTVPSIQVQSSNFEFLGTDMYTYSKMESDINLLKQRYDGVTSDTIGTTQDGRNIYRIVIGNRQAAKKILVIGSIHAREYITTPLVMRQVQEMLDRRGGGDNVLDNVCIHYVPMLNPDGVAISQYGVDGLNKEESKQKLREIIQSWSEWGLNENQDKYNWFLNKWKNNLNGVDINRNFPTQGWAQKPDSRKKPSNEFFKGFSGGSESETQDLMKLVNTENYNAVLNYHTQGQIIYWSNQHASAEVLAQNKAMADITAAHTGYKLVAPSADGSKFGTGFKDWLDWEKSIPSVTVEVGIGVSPVPEIQIETIWQQNKGVLPDIVNYVLNGQVQNKTAGEVLSPSVQLEAE